MKQRTEDNRIGEKKFMIQSRDFMLYHGMNDSEWELRGRLHLYLWGMI